MASEGPSTERAPPPIWFVSDVHLSPDRPERTARFLRFLAHRVAPAGAELIVNGDLFDWWFGSPGPVPEDVAEVIAALEALPRPVIWLEGNHDLFVGHGLRSDSPIGTSPGGLDFARFGLRVHVEHGDQVDPSARSYLAFRALLRGLPGRAAARIVGPRLTRFAGSRAAAGSRTAQGGVDGHDGASPQWLAAAQSFAARRPEDLVVLGHGHWLGYWPGLICLGDWLRRDSYARLEPGGASLWRYQPEGDVCLMRGPRGAIS